MRKPMAKGLASMNTPRCSSMRKRVARAVAQREHHVAAVQRLAAGEHHALDLAVLDEQVGDLALEAHLAAERDDLLAHRRPPRR